MMYGKVKKKKIYIHLEIRVLQLQCEEIRLNVFERKQNVFDQDMVRDWVRAVVFYVRIAGSNISEKNPRSVDLPLKL